MESTAAPSIPNCGGQTVIEGVMMRSRRVSPGRRQPGARLAGLACGTCPRSNTHVLCEVHHAANGTHD